MPFDCAQNGFTPFRPRVLRFYECIPNILIEVGFGPEQSHTLKALPANTQRLSTVGSATVVPNRSVVLLSHTDQQARAGRPGGLSGRADWPGTGRIIISDWHCRAALALARAARLSHCHGPSQCTGCGASLSAGATLRPGSPAAGRPGGPAARRPSKAVVTVNLPQDSRTIWQIKCSFPKLERNPDTSPD